MTKKEPKPTGRMVKKRPKTVATNQLGLVDKLMKNVNRIHKRV